MFGTLLGLEERTSLENPTLSLNDPAAWDAVFGDEYRSASGQKVTKKRALMCAAVWAAVSLISGHIARLPLDVYKKKTTPVAIDEEGNETGGDQTREIDEYHPAHWLVRHQFHDELPAF